MLDTPKIKRIYNDIQKQIYILVPEKWQSIYLYASITRKIRSLPTWEMFFYYYPQSVIKKKPINVYEIPAKFNVDEDEYLELVDKLCETIKKLRSEYEKVCISEKLWSSITLKITKKTFTIYLNYDNLEKPEFSNNERHIIWKYEYLNIPIEQFSKKEKNIIEKYKKQEKQESQVFTENIEEKQKNSKVEYNQKIEKSQESQEIKNKNIENLKTQILKY